MPTLEENVSVLLTYGIQSDINTVATAGGTSQRLRRVSSSLNGQKDTFASNEVRADQQISDMRHGGRRWDGTISGELSTVTYDDFFAALMRQSAWTTGVDLDQADFTSITISAGVWTFGSGNPSTLGLRIGDIIDATGLSVTANNARYRITALTSTTITAIKLSDGSVAADNTTDTSCAIAVVGKKLLMGTTKTAFTLEQNYPTIDVSEVFKHGRVAGAAVRIPPNGIATIDWQFQGRDWENLDGSSAPYFTSVTAAGNSQLLTGLEGGLRLNGEEQAVVTGLDFNIALNMSSAPVIGTPLVPDIHYGRSVVNGNTSFFLEDKALLEVFRAETEVDLVATTMAPDGSFLAFNFQRIKLGAAQKQIGADGGVLVQAPFQALLKSSGTGYDQTTLSIQRSNA